MIEFDHHPENLDAVLATLDQSMQEQNSYYLDLIAGKILQPLKISSLSAGSFKKYMKSQGKLGGQNKIPRLSNDRKIADALLEISA